MQAKTSQKAARISHHGCAYISSWHIQVLVGAARTPIGYIPPFGRSTQEERPPPSFLVRGRADMFSICSDFIRGRKQVTKFLIAISGQEKFLVSISMEYHLLSTNPGTPAGGTPLTKHTLLAPPRPNCSPPPGADATASLIRISKPSARCACTCRKRFIFITVGTRYVKATSIWVMRKSWLL